MPVLIKLERFKGMKQQFQCPGCGHPFSTGRKRPSCPECKMISDNPDALEEEARKREEREEEKRQKKYSSISQGPGVRGDEYIKWRDDLIAESGIRKGRPCPCCGKWIHSEIGQVELHHILRRRQFPALVRVNENVFIGCSRAACGDALDSAKSTGARLEKILEMGEQIIRAMPVPAAERPVGSRALVDWCLEMHQKYGVPIKNGASNARADDRVPD